MTVQEAIKELHNIRPLGGIIPQKRAEAIDVAIESMEEVERYRVLEKKLNGISVEHIVNAFIERAEKDTNEGYEKGRILTNAEADMWEQYRALGTVEELKEAREKQVAKKPKYKTTCEKCGTHNSVWGRLANPKGHPIVYCWNCGQANELDWEEGGTSD